MLNIFEYTDFRKYLTDYYEDRKKENPRFSYRLLTLKSGLNSGNFAKMLKGERNLTIESAIQLARVLKLSKRERDYFQTMILFCQSKTHEDKRQYFEELLTFKESAVCILDSKNYLFYEKWYYTAVREALAFFPLSENNFAVLGKNIIPSISEKQVAEAIDLLLNLNLIEKDQNGLYRRTNMLLSTGNDIRSITLNNFVINTMRLAEQAINTGLKETNLSSVSFSISDKVFSEVQEEIRTCRRRIMEIAQNCNSPNRVFQLNVQLFPMTDRYDGRYS